MSFQQIPELDLSLAQDPATKEQFLTQLRHALVNVGFLLLRNFDSPSAKDLQAIREQAEAFFALPQSAKNQCEMVNSPHFLGYSRLANEVTSSQTDWREQIDLATELPAPKDGPIYRQIEGPNLWPDEALVPDFRPVVTNYIAQMTSLATQFRRLVAEALGLEPTAFDRFFKPNQQCKMKIVAYPDTKQLSSAQSHVLEDTPSTGQGCGPHRDSDFLTYIFQATNHASLQVQNFQGQWITVENVPGTLVVNVGQTLEAISSGVCRATIHRVLIPEAGSGTRLSVPLFQTIDLDSRKTALALPKEILQERDRRDDEIENGSGGKEKRWGDAGFQFAPDAEHPVGHAVFRNRIKSHPDVAARWYPEILREVQQEMNAAKS
ncbi:hypothetical protein CLUG_02063 [Clavispora lusitaniae ATCC 42720]|uniref:Fe2OG dioxygenase domain-containing protein n=1 Tax=Clavispora lusitaniae (strain ATCC 42720) TaxID=306902 RepID=C4Y1I1_CLAL4|nr:uncharacterized protein CLUG_02063 [Clavispora lusitaniae ATCC 42720]EEQ37939.1 hypothetical protein CLUG_02063 [Clavispora lusitaniae ATCC 42720]